MATLVEDPATCWRAGLGHRTVDDLIQPNRVLELYDDGAVLVLRGLQLSEPHLARVPQNLALAFDDRAGQRVPVVDDASARVTAGIMAVTWQRVVHHALEAAMVDRDDVARARGAHLDAQTVRRRRPCARSVWAIEP